MTPRLSAVRQGHLLRRHGQQIGQLLLCVALQERGHPAALRGLAGEGESLWGDGARLGDRWQAGATWSEVAVLVRGSVCCVRKLALFFYFIFGSLMVFAVRMQLFFSF